VGGVDDDGAPQQRDQRTLEHLSRAECLDLLATVSVGRIAVARRGEAPLVVPVNFVLDGEVIVLRTDPGQLLDTLRDEPGSFQVDWIDPLHRTGWSVLVQGFAYETSPAEEPIDPWAPGPKDHWVRIFPGAITGRRIVLADIPTDGRGYA
jgi:hypothetical protein